MASLGQQHTYLRDKIDQRLVDLRAQEETLNLQDFLLFIEPYGCDFAPSKDPSQLKPNQEAIKGYVPDLTGKSASATDKALTELRQAETDYSPFTRIHAGKVGFYLKELALKLGHDDATSDILGTSGDLHDIGKLGVSRSILNHPGRLNEEQFAHIQEHTTLGAAMLLQHEGVYATTAAIMALYHHEAFDGSGYFGLKGNEIPYAARLCQVVDVFEAMTAKRPYKMERSPEEVLEMMNAEPSADGRGLGRHLFDPKVLSTFNEIARPLFDLAQIKFGDSSLALEQENAVTEDQKFKQTEEVKAEFDKQLVSRRSSRMRLRP